MESIVVLVRENPFGSFLIICIAIWAIERMVVAIAHRNRPPAAQCDCSCCQEEDEEEEEE